MTAHDPLYELLYIWLLVHLYKPDAERMMAGKPHRNVNFTDKNSGFVAPPFIPRSYERL